MQKLKIVFAGTPDIAVPSLRALAADPNFKIAEVWTQPDRPGNRGKIQRSAVALAAEEIGLSIFQPAKIGEAENERLANLNVDFLVVVAYGILLPASFLDIPKFGAINLHASLLPKFRGASPIQSAILAGEKETGASFMQITPPLDAGPVFAQFAIEIGNKNSVELSAALAEIGAQKFPEILQKITAGDFTAEKQNDEAATACTKISKADGEANFEKDSAEILERKLRAFTPWPGIFTTFAGENLKLRQFTAAENFKAAAAGEVFAHEKKIFVATSDGALEIQSVQPAGKKEMPITDFVRGKPEFLRARLFAGGIPSRGPTDK